MPIGDHKSGELLLSRIDQTLSITNKCIKEYFGIMKLTSSLVVITVIEASALKKCI